MAAAEGPTSSDSLTANGATLAANGRHDGDGGGAGAGVGRPARLPRWTRQEILVLIQGKRVAEGRCRRGRAAAAAGGGPALEPKWAAVAAYCRRHGVNRGPVQCRKRWSNLAGDFKKIREWEVRKADESESFWVMRNDVRRERRLPGFFDREVYDILDAGAAGAEEEEVEVEVVFDSGRPAAPDEGMFSDCDDAGQEEKETEVAAENSPLLIAAPTPISKKQYQPFEARFLDAGLTNEKQPTENPEKASTSEGQKRRRVSPDREGLSDVQNQLIEILERNSRMLVSQLEAQNLNCQLDRDQRKDHTDSLIDVIGKVADALGRIADKL